MFILIAPLITAPYIARVLSPELIGEYSYTVANCSYFVLVAGLGLPLYGTLRAVSIRDDREKLSRLFWEITLLKMILMIVCVFVYFCTIIMHSNGIRRNLYYIVAIEMFANAIDVTWLLTALEKFKITALSSMFVRLINVIAIFLLVKNQKDIYLYALILQGAALAGCLALLPSLRNCICKVEIKDLNLTQHMIPNLTYFVPGIIHTIFSAADKTMLGLFSDSTYEIGVYEQANKICLILVSAISAISNVILPRMTYLYSKNSDDEVMQDLKCVSIRIALFVAMPMVLGISAIADLFVLVYFGDRYEKSGILLKILCWNVLFSSLCNFCGHQGLIARGKQSAYNVAFGVSAAANVIMNAILVTKYQSVGVSLASVLASVISFCLILYFSREVFSINYILKIGHKYILAAIFMYVAVICSRYFLKANYTVILGIQMIIGVMTYLLGLLLLRDALIEKFLKRLNYIFIRREER